MALLHHHNLRLLLPILLLVLGFNSSRGQQKPNYRKVAVVDSAEGVASFYADKFVGRTTANGEVFSQSKLTCAHNTLPFGTMVRVTNIKNGQSVVLRVNDRLHHRNPRLVDVSRAAAKRLGFNRSGIIRVRVEVVRSDSVAVASKIQ